LQARDLPVETFPALDAPGLCRHVFVRRVPGVEVGSDKTEALARLDAMHREVRVAVGLGNRKLLTAEQVHGDGLAVIDRPVPTDGCFAGCDGLLTNRADVCLGIYVADCCALYLVDPIRRCLGLVHSGRKGTELGIATRAVQRLQEHFGSRPNDLVVQLGPCIRPPHYEVDFAAEIARQCREAGVKNVHDCGISTATDLSRYYSYRMEKGRTGRMMALLALA
jgi:purine-nucleoside/S-methyl-5'-thioadenosine phosphorylase / adenosine deaminase